MFDENGILGQDESYEEPAATRVARFGGGDSASWHGVYTYLGLTNMPFSDLFEKGFGGYARHPSEGYSSYYKHPWDGRITRDQLTGIIAALTAQRDVKALFRVFLHHACWLLLFTYSTRENGYLSKWKWPDLTAFDIWAMYIRGFLGKWSWFAYPLLIVLDIHNFFNALFQKYTKSDHSLNYIVKLLISLEYAPTPISLLTSKINSRESLRISQLSYWCGWRGNCFMVDEMDKKMKSLGVK